MDSKERREAPTEDFNQRIQYKLELRSKAIQKVLWSKRIPQVQSQGIKGYDLSKHCHRRKFKIKKCWDCGSTCHYCGSTCHLRANFKVDRESKLRKRVSGLERRIEELEAAYLNQIDNKKKRDKRKRKKTIKKKKKKNLKIIKATDVVVKIRECLLKEEKERTGEHVLKGAEYLDSIPGRDKARVLKAYKELFNRDCPVDIGEAFCYDDDFGETRYQMEQNGELCGT